MANNTKHPTVICRTRNKDRGFTLNDNTSTDDMNLSLEAMAVHHIFKRWSTFEAEGFVCSKSFIQSKSRSGDKKFERIWKELKEKGYIKMYCVGQSNWTAELLEDPEPDTPHTYYLNVAGEVKRTVGGTTKIGENSNPPQKGGDSKKPDFNPPLLRGDSKSGDSKSGGLKEGNNINTSFKNSFNNNFINNQSIYQYEPEKTLHDKMIDRWIEANDQENIKEYLQDKIDYEYCIEQHDICKEELDNVVSILADMFTTTESKTYNRRKYEPWQIREKIEKLNGDAIKFALDNINAVETPIKNLRKYTETALFFAPDTVDLALSRDYLQARQSQ